MLFPNLIKNIWRDNARKSKKGTKLKDINLRVIPVVLLIDRLIDLKGIPTVNHTEIRAAVPENITDQNRITAAVHAATKDLRGAVLLPNHTLHHLERAAVLKEGTPGVQVIREVVHLKAEDKVCKV